MARREARLISRGRRLDVWTRRSGAGWLALLLLNATPAQACSPTATPNPGYPTSTIPPPIPYEEHVRSLVEGATYVVEGTMVSATKVQVKRYLKGTGDDVLDVGQGACTFVEAGTNGIFFIYDNASRSDGIVHHDKDVRADQPTLQQIRAVVGHDPVEPETLQSRTVTFWATLLAGIIAIATIVGIAWAISRRAWNR
jgi:hypothetical protein